MTHQTAVAWLKTAAWLLIIIGVYFSWALYAPLNAASLLFLDLAFLPFDGSQNLSGAETKLMVAIVGGLTVGIGAATLAITQHVYAGNPDLGRRLLWTMFLPWFLVDGVGSVLAGAWFNVVLNTVILGSVAPPLLLARPSAQTA